MNYKIEMWEGLDGQWYWHIASNKNGQIVLTSEGYASKSNCKRSVSKIMSSIAGPDWKTKYLFVTLLT
jgi:uncharacterized protein YegP (UPF0339 family)